jgi:hypothetical protein
MNGKKWWVNLKALEQIATETDMNSEVVEVVEVQQWNTNKEGRENEKSYRDSADHKQPGAGNRGHVA